MSDMYTKKDVSDSTIELTITIPRDNFDKSYKALLKDQIKDKDIKGFRKGKIPKDLIEPSMKPMLQFETFEKLAPMYINTAIQKEKIELIAPPKYSKLPEFKGEKDLEFQVEITIMPDFKLGNLKKVKIEKEDTKIDEKDVEKVLKELKIKHETDAKKIGDDWAKEMGKKLKLDGVKDLKSFKSKIKDLKTHQSLKHLYHPSSMPLSSVLYLNYSALRNPLPLFP